jgi:hypothetical protein
MFRGMKILVWIAALLALVSTAHADEEGEVDCFNYRGNPYYSAVDNRAMCWIRLKIRSYEGTVNGLVSRLYPTDPLDIEGGGPFEITRAEFIEAASNVLENFRLRKFEFAGPDTRETRKVVLDRKAAALRVVERAFDDFSETAAMLDRSLTRAGR